jgi:adenine-specific DNA methylase
VFYEDGDGNRRYRELNDTDTTALAEAQSEYRESLGTLPLPISKIQEGKTTGRLLDYGYEQYQQLFTERQRIALGQLLELADEQEPREVAETIVTLVVATLHYNNIHARWDTRGDSVQTIFRTFRHSIPVETVEANPLVDEWKGSLRSAYDRYVAAKTYLESPSETLRTPAGDRAEIQLPEEALRTERIKQLAVSSVDQLDIETKSVDCAVIDPPYYDAVQQGELHDFHYRSSR